MRYPRAFVDEAWFASRAWAFLSTGRQFGPLDQGVFDQLEGHWTAYPILSALFQAAGLALEDRPQLWLARLVSLLFGGGLLLAVVAIGRAMADTTTGLMAAVVLAASPSFFMSAHLARPDVMAAALAYGAWAVYATRARAPRRLAGLSGLLAAFALEVHPYAVVGLLGLAGVVLLDLRACRLDRGGLFALVAGGVLGVAWYLGLHVFPYPDTYARIMQIAFEGSHGPPLFSGDVAAIGAALLGSARTARQIGAPLVLAALTGAALLLRLGGPGRLLGASARALGGAALIACAGFVLLIASPFQYYLIQLTPALALAAAGGIVPLWSRFGQPAARVIAALLLCASASGSIEPLGAIALDRSVAFERALSDLRGVVAPEDALIGPQTYWFGLPEHRYYSWEQLVYIQRFDPSLGWEDALAVLHPDILIIDDHLRMFIRDAPATQLYRGTLHIPKRTLEGILARRARLVARLPNDIFGELLVFRLRWDAVASGGAP